MKINTSGLFYRLVVSYGSWHLHTSLEKDIPKTLCQVIPRFLFGLFWICFLVFISSYISLILLEPIVAIILHNTVGGPLNFLDTTSFSSDGMGFLFLLGCMAWVCIAAFVVVGLAPMLINQTIITPLKNVLLLKTTSLDLNNIIGEYFLLQNIKTIYQCLRGKLCPIIEYYDKNEDKNYE